jgi:formate hydrogenlyase subunit 6/NADH:ubiquinone oxidoreductase subunit I
MSIKSIKVQADRCCGCQLCQTVCSIFHFKETNPKKSAIWVKGEFPAPGKYKIAVCIQCGKCAEACPVDAIYKNGNAYKVDPEKCTLCWACAEVCPTGVIVPHDEYQYMFKCDLCGECVAICPTKALTEGK